MAAGAFTLFRANLDDLRLADLPSATVKLALVSSGYTPSAGTSGHSVWADVSTYQIANGNGYTADGASLASGALLSVANGFAYDSADVTWTASGGAIPAWRYGVLYVDGTLWGKTNPLIGYFVGDATPADVPATADGDQLTVEVNVAGWFNLTQA